MKTIRIFLLVLIIIGIVAICTQNFWVPKLVNYILSSQGVGIESVKVKPIAVTGLECHDSQKYFAISQSLTDSVGSNILIKYKTKPNQVPLCDYKVAKGDFEIKNVTAEYFLTFTDNFLVLDGGTAPDPRKLIAYNLSSRKIVFTDSYSKPVKVVGDSLEYFSKTSQKPTIQNCSDLKKYTENGLGAVIMAKITVDLSSLVTKDIGIIKCIATQ